MNTYYKYLASFYAITAMATVYGSDEKPRPLTFTESIFLGGTVGAAEVLFPGQPLSYAMNHAIKQKSKPIAQRTPINWRNSYQGLTANAVGQMPITAVQKAVQVKGSQLTEQTQGQALSTWQKMMVSYMAGVAGAFIDTPSNAIQLHLQKEGNGHKNTLQAAKELGKNCGRGFTVNALLKEGPFAVGYQMLAGEGEKIAQQYVGDNLAATAMGGAGAGVVTAIATHPGAVLRNKIQSDVSQSIGQVVTNTIKQEGWTAFLTGLPARGTRVAIAVPLYVAYTTFLENLMRKFSK